MRYPPAPASASASAAASAAHFSSTQNQHPRRPRLSHHATTYDRPNPADDTSLRGLADRRPREPVLASRPTLSPQLRDLHATSRRARDAGRDKPVDPDYRPAPIARHRDADPRLHNPRRRSSSPSRNHERLSRRASSHRQISRDRLRGPDHRIADPFPGNRDPNPRDRFWDHEALLPPDSHVAPRRPPSGASIGKAHRPAPRRRSPLPYHDRQRSRSRNPIAAESRARQPRPVSSYRRSDREQHDPRLPPCPTHAKTSPPREYIPKRHEERRLEGSGRPLSLRPLDRERSCSPLSQAFDDNPNLVPLGQRPSSRLEASDHLLQRYRRSYSPPRRWTPSPLQGGQYLATQATSSRAERTPDFDDGIYPPPQSPGSPQRVPRELFPSHSRNTRAHPRREERHPDFAVTGVNSIEVNMSARGNFRGSYGGQYPVRGHFNQGSNDQRNFAHSTPGSSFQGSPPAQSPYPSSRGNWGGQQQLSPQK